MINFIKASTKECVKVPMGVSIGVCLCATEPGCAHAEGERERDNSQAKAMETFQLSEANNGAVKRRLKYFCYANKSIKTFY